MPGNIKYHIHVEKEIAISHQLKRHKGKCQNVHGHNLLVEVDMWADSLIKNNLLSNDGMIADFGDIKEEIDKLDHKDLNEFFIGMDNMDDMGRQPTAERVANYFAHRIYFIAYSSNQGVTKIAIRVWESRTQYAECTLS